MTKKIRNFNDSTFEAWNVLKLIIVFAKILNFIVNSFWNIDSILGYC